MYYINITFEKYSELGEFPHMQISENLVTFAGINLL